MDKFLDIYTERQINKATKIKVVISDVDGVLTDGGIIYDSQGNELKKFNVKDGLIVKFLRAKGIKVGVISGRKSFMVEKRLSELKVDFCYQGIEDKNEQFQKVKKQYGVTNEQVAYLGDDINDLVLIKSCGLGVVPGDAPQYIKEQADLITTSLGGKGVLRETGDLILAAQGHLNNILKQHLNID